MQQQKRLRVSAGTGAHLRGTGWSSIHDLRLKMHSHRRYECCRHLSLCGRGLRRPNFHWDFWPHIGTTRAYCERTTAPRTGKELFASNFGQGNQPCKTPDVHLRTTNSALLTSYLFTSQCLQTASPAAPPAARRRPAVGHRPCIFRLKFTLTFVPDGGYTRALACNTGRALTVSTS